MDRGRFLRRMMVPTVGVAAGAAAKALDPDGEPIPDTAPLIQVNAPGATLSNLRIDASGSRRTAVQLAGGRHIVRDSIILN